MIASTGVCREHRSERSQVRDASFVIVNIRLSRIFSATARLLASSSAKTKNAMLFILYLCVCSSGLVQFGEGFLRSGSLLNTTLRRWDDQGQNNNLRLVRTCSDTTTLTQEVSMYVGLLPGWLVVSFSVAQTVLRNTHGDRTHARDSNVNRATNTHPEAQRRTL
jgi:hypothetical protein